MIKLKAILNHPAFFPVLMLYYGVLYILYGEIYFAHEGLTTDGYVYASIVSEFKTSFFFDSFYIHRIFPCLLVRAFLTLFSIEINTHTIVVAFQILNLASIVLSCYFLKKIFVLWDIKLKIQLLAFTLFLSNFALLKFPFYMPVMTDTCALVLSSGLLYSYFKNNVYGLMLCTLLLAFTWPMGYYQGLLLLAFPMSVLPFVELKKWQRIFIPGVSILYILLACVFIVFVFEKDTTVALVAKIDRGFLPLSILSLMVLYFFFAKLFFNQSLFDLKLFFSKINYWRVLMAVIIFIASSLIVYFLNPKSVQLYSLSYILSNPILLSLVKPLIAIVSHVSYFGVIICLLILFWNSICKVIVQMGWGVIAALALNLFLFGINSETRTLINLLPILIVLFAKTVNHYHFSNGFYIVVAFLSLFSSKVWLLLNNNEGYPPMQLDKNGSMGFPDQKIWMNIGPWMNEQMYYVQGAFVLVFIVILFFMLYKVQLQSNNKIKLVRKYTTN